MQADLSQAELAQRMGTHQPSIARWERAPMSKSGQNMKSLKHPNLQCIYCDDIRDEVGGKTTIVGWYGGVPVSLPEEGALLIPSLGIIGVLTMPSDSKYKSMKVEFMQNEHVLQSVVMPDQALNEMKVPVDQSAESLFGREVRIAIKMINLQIADPCTLRMRVVIDEEEIYGNGLDFERNKGTADSYGLKR
jgi:hypothetical protein